MPYCIFKVDKHDRASNQNQDKSKGTQLEDWMWHEEKNVGEKLWLKLCKRDYSSRLMQ